MTWKSTNVVEIVNVGKSCKVVEVEVAKDDIFYGYNHMIKKGMKYLNCNYLEKPKEIRGKVCYRMLRDFVFVLPGHVMSPIVNLNENLELAMDEYQWLLDSI